MLGLMPGCHWRAATTWWGLVGGSGSWLARVTQTWQGSGSPAVTSATGLVSKRRQLTGRRYQWAHLSAALRQQLFFQLCVFFPLFSSPCHNLSVQRLLVAARLARWKWERPSARCHHIRPGMWRRAARLAGKLWRVQAACVENSIALLQALAGEFSVVPDVSQLRGAKS